MIRFGKTAILAVLLAASYSMGTQSVQESPYQMYENLHPGLREDPYVFAVGENAGLRSLVTNPDLFSDSDWFRKTICDFCYWGPTRRLYTRSISLIENEDPVDLSFARSPGTYPNHINPDPRVRNIPWSMIGQLGGRDWGKDGPMAYGAALTFHKFSTVDGQVAACISTAPMTDSKGRYSGQNVRGENLQPRVCVFPNGDIVLGYDSDPNRPSNIFIQGQLHLERAPVYYRGDAWTEVSKTLGQSQREEIETLDRMRMGLKEKID